MRAVSALMELLLALRSDGTLAWSLKHAPDGDRDAALRRAWESETLPTTLIYCAEFIDDSDAEYAFNSISERKCGCVTGLKWTACQPCCDAIRAVVSCPSYAELSP